MTFTQRIVSLVLALSITTASTHAEVPVTSTSDSGIRKIKDLIVYRDDAFHCAFPSIVKRSDGELLVAFRRAPDRRKLGEAHYTHTDPNSYLELVRSHDNGESWSAKPELLYANPYGGSQDPCMIQLKDNSILCSSFGWASIRPEAAKNLKNLSSANGFALLGGYILRSTDDGKHWDDPIFPRPIPDATAWDIFGKPISPYNRGAMSEGKNGKLYWVVANTDVSKHEKTATHLLISSDKGKTWDYSCPVARDEKIAFNETSIYETPKGDLVAFMRTANLDDHTVIARSTNGGKSFNPWEDAGFQGCPHFALRLPDQRVLLVYGYRHAPMGIRARVLDAECTNFKTASEMILRDDGGGADLGYPWAVMLSKHRALVVYYFNQNDGPRYIAGTLLEVK